MGTELRARGASVPDYRSSAWSAMALVHDPGTVRQVHSDYIAAGADVITANNYAVVPNLLARVGMADRLEELTRLACQLALEARAANRRPEVRVAGSLPPPGREKNAIRKEASAILSVRLAPGQTRDEMLQALRDTLCAQVPGGVQVTLTEKNAGSMSWDYHPQGPAFEAADRAYEAAWGKKPLRIGVGGSIPFVALFGRRFASLPLILNGVMDPQTTAHGPNESLHLGVFHKAMLANVHLLDELAAALRKG
jgi:acetylornithine deacetylase/succinyl-diaminopimelate desuccinylase-like protein